MLEKCLRLGDFCWDVIQSSGLAWPGPTYQSIRSTEKASCKLNFGTMDIGIIKIALKEEDFFENCEVSNIALHYVGGPGKLFTVLNGVELP